ncbi:C39 family peptidase [Acetanaerobacterium elongatum]|uniref:Peptidase_C39 like family protein n=1 Tax=Acetanaerobacterium elongatum TaxID=258515 RepID=A0A1H0G320_9FIRM|nr:C39 family peptidase [Acetanaerobacterium elongatum]SDO01286.1 Peptidase_C39 like family protein [Acetanaerobacterium elongatum]
MRQDDSRWASTLIPGSNYTYSGAGCAMTSYAMVFSYYGSNVTPVDVGNTYYNRTNPQQSPIDFNVRTLVPMYSRSISAIDTVSSRSSLEAVIVGGIFSGYPTVLKMTRSNGDTHFIVAYGCFQATASDPTIIYIRDPESHINYSTLNKYYDKGWTAANYVTVS